MKDFFTFGGGQFWEDVFFYQKWRIQRNYKEKVYRLLDPWDIKRAEGSFEDCRKSFVHFIEVYQLSRQKGHMIIMLHGLGDSKNIFKPMWRRALKEGYLAASLNYPSTLKNTEGHVRQIDFMLNHLEDVSTVSFITKGCGGIVLRKLMALDTEWKNKLKIGRIVQICPPNLGSKIFYKLTNYSFFRGLLGPMLSEMTPSKAKYWPNFPDDIDVGIITFNNLYAKDEESYLSGAKKIHVKNMHFNPLKNPEIVEAAINFIKNGNF